MGIQGKSTITNEETVSIDVQKGEFLNEVNKALEEILSKVQEGDTIIFNGILISVNHS